MNQQTNIGAYLKNQRQKQGFSQKKLAETANCSPSALCMFEKGKTEALSPERLNKICEVLGLEDGSLIASAAKKFCPNEFCPSHKLYVLGNGQSILQPEAIMDNPGTHCVWCGTTYVSACDFCETAFSGDGAFCPDCGTAYVAISNGRTIDESIHTNFKNIQTQTRSPGATKGDRT